MSTSRIGCDSYFRMNRRGVLKASAMGAATLMGMRVRDLVAFADEPDAKKIAKADHVILLWMSGGMSHIDTWDPKPDHENGGEFKGIKSSADGVQIGEILPQTAKQMHRSMLIRSLFNNEGDHGRATYNLLTNYKPAPQLVHPPMGSIVSHELAQIGDLPSYVSIGGRSLSAGYLGNKCEAYYIGQPGTPDPYVSVPEAIGQERAKRRMNLLREFNGHYEAQMDDVQLQSTAHSYEAAVRFMASPALKAFELDKEKPAVKAAYGDTTFGRGCLLARRLVEHGVRFVQVNLGGFDTHGNNFPRMRSLGGTLDPALAALVSDLAAAGLLERTVVCVLSEFGRTPRINGNAGRDHYPRCFSTFLAGGGFKSGYVHGESDAGGEAAVRDTVRPGDLHATICTHLGIDPDKQVETPIGRPMRLVDQGQVVKGISR